MRRALIGLGVVVVLVGGFAMVPPAQSGVDTYVVITPARYAIAPGPDPGRLELDAYNPENLRKDRAQKSHVVLIAPARTAEKSGLTLAIERRMHWLGVY